MERDDLRLWFEMTSRDDLTDAAVAHRMIEMIDEIEGETKYSIQLMME